MTNVNDTLLQLENEMIEDKLNGDRDDIKFLLENAIGHDTEIFNTMLLASYINEDDTSEMMDIALNAIVTPLEKENEFYNKYGVNLIMARQTSLNLLGRVYQLHDGLRKTIVEMIYRKMKEVG